MRKADLLFVLAIATVLMALAPGAYAGVSVSVSNVAVSKSTVCRPDTSIGVSATVSATFDSDSSSTNTGRCVTQRSGGDITGYQRSDDTTYTFYTNKTVSVTAADSNGNSTAMSTLDSSNYAGSLPVGPDGRTTLTVSASAQEDKTVRTDTTASNWPASAGGCTGDPSSFDTTQGSPSTTTVTSGKAVTGSASYIADLVPGHFKLNGTEVDPPGAPPTVNQGGTVRIGTNVQDGSANTPFSATATLLGSSTSYSITIQGFSSSDPNFDPDAFFGNSQHNDGIDNEKHIGPLAIRVPCDAPPGTYSLALTIKTQDLCGQAFDDLVTEGRDITVLQSGVTLQGSTIVLSELPDVPLPGYGIEQCFTALVAQKNINTFPGSWHIASTLTSQVKNASGDCPAGNTLSGTTMYLTIPAGMKWADTGKSPTAHIFSGSASGFDLHLGSPLPEVTSLVKQSLSNNLDGSSTVTIDLKGIEPIPVGNIVYARAHNLLTVTRSASLPSPFFGNDISFLFASSANVTSLNGNPVSLTTSSTYTIKENPTNAVSGYVCVDGRTTPPQ